jgi:hypothetical protein
MDGQRFDSIAKTLATAGTRRRVLQAFAVAIVGGVYSFVGGPRVSRVIAASRCRTDADCPSVNPSCVNGRCRSAACPSGSDFCQDVVNGCAPGCGCASAIDGTIFCTDSVGCIACSSDADCEAYPFFGTGSACVVATGPKCNCVGGKGCARACQATLDPTDCTGKPDGTVCGDGHSLCINETCISEAAFGPSPPLPGLSKICFVAPSSPQCAKWIEKLRKSCGKKSNIDLLICRTIIA